MTLETHNPKGSIVLYHMHNGGHEDTIVEERRGILEKARDLENEDAMEFKWGDIDIPPFSLVLMVPNIPGQALCSTL